MRPRVAVAVAGIVLVGGCAAPNDFTEPAPFPSVTATTAPPPSPPSGSPTTTSPPPVTHRAELRRGDRGPDVLDWQRRLTALGYWAGVPDSEFGLLTEQATYAAQKAAGLPRTGRVTAAVRRAVAIRVRPVPRSRAGRVVEIDLAGQLLLVVEDGRLVTILNTSTGSARTPTAAGRFHVYAQIDGLRRSPLGLLWRPKYFDGGIAVHGYTSVPPWPASHGCVRLTYAAIDRIWSDGLVPLGTDVWVY